MQELVIAALAPLWTVQVDPLTTALGFVHVQVERALSPAWSVYVGPHLRLFDSLLDDTHLDLLGLGAEVGVRWYFTGVAPSGGWILARGVGARLSTSVNGPEETGFGGYVSALGGYTWILADRWVLSAGAGVQSLHYAVGGEGIEGILPAAHTALGVAF